LSFDLSDGDKGGILFISSIKKRQTFPRPSARLNVQTLTTFKQRARLCGQA